MDVMQKTKTIFIAPVMELLTPIMLHLKVRQMVDVWDGIDTDTFHGEKE